MKHMIHLKMIVGSLDPDLIPKTDESGSLIFLTICFGHIYQDPIISEIYLLA